MPCRLVHLTLEERPRLERLREAKVRVDEIARQLGRHCSTVYRALKRNWWHDAGVPRAEGYRLVTARQNADGRRRSFDKLARHPALSAAVIGRLRNGWSLEQIVGRLKHKPDTDPRR